MSETIFIGVAWPYANGPLHLGQIAGANLPADIFARYQRLKGNKVLMVSGTDQHGTPVTLRAEQEGVTPQVLVSKYHSQYVQSWKQLGITFDCYTSTGTENHKKVVHDLFLNLYQKGFIYPATSSHPFCGSDNRFLPDRYVEGTCPHCGNKRARGDQCEACGKPLNQQDLIGWKCRICGSEPILRDSEHFFLRLSAMEQSLLSWIQQWSGFWRPNVFNFTHSWLQEGLLDRSVTRDIEWGISVPVDGYESKSIYVWFEAVIGYLSASKEWAVNEGDPDAWEEFWLNPECKAYYFLGKDNIAFHTIIWPAMLMGYGDFNIKTHQGKYNLPFNVPANEFLSLEGKKLSTSQNWAVWLSDYLSRFDPDPLRYYLSANMPEHSDSDFSWHEFFRRNNDELVGTYGNLVHRVLSLIHQYFQGAVPVPKELDDQDKSLLSAASVTHTNITKSLDLCHFREAIVHAMALAGETNRYIDFKAPWKTAKDDLERCATTLWVALNLISTLKTVLTPFLPFSSANLHSMLGFPGELDDQGWTLQEPIPGTKLGDPKPLFLKLDDQIVEEETNRLKSQSRQ